MHWILWCYIGGAVLTLGWLLLAGYYRDDESLFSGFRIFGMVFICVMWVTAVPYYLVGQAWAERKRYNREEGRGLIRQHMHKKLQKKLGL